MKGPNWKSPGYLSPATFTHNNQTWTQFSYPQFKMMTLTNGSKQNSIFFLTHNIHTFLFSAIVKTYTILILLQYLVFVPQRAYTQRPSLGCPAGSATDVKICDQSESPYSDGQGGVCCGLSLSNPCARAGGPSSHKSLLRLI